MEYMSEMIQLNAKSGRLNSIAITILALGLLFQSFLIRGLQNEVEYLHEQRKIHHELHNIGGYLK